MTALKNSEVLMRKARGRTAKWPVQSVAFTDAIVALMPAFEAFGSAIHAAATKDVLGRATHGCFTVTSTRVLSLIHI